MAGLYGENLIDYIIRGSRSRGLDPAAVLAVASVEGGFYGATGDSGSSFGPFQLHEGGALPSRYTGNRTAAKAWANSPAGIDYALNGIATVARGKTGHSAIESIVTSFERPLDVAAEIVRAAASLATWTTRVGSGSSGGKFPNRPIGGTLPGHGTGGAAIVIDAKGGKCPPGYKKYLNKCVLQSAIDAGVVDPKGAPLGGFPGGGAIQSGIDAIKAPFEGIADVVRWIGDNWDRILEVIGGFLLLLLGLYRLASQLGTAPSNVPAVVAAVK